MLTIKVIALCSFVALITLFMISVYTSRTDEQQALSFFCGTAALEEERTGPLNDIEAKGYKLFNSNCTSCHALNDTVAGPPLANVTRAHSEKWLIAFIRNPQKMIRSKDQEALRSYRDFNESVMTSFENLTDEEIRSILAYLKKSSPTSLP